MQSELTVRDLMHDADNLIAADEPVQSAVPQFELETTRSLILIDGSGPIGLLTRQQVRGLSDDERQRPARDFMIDVPVLEQSLPITAALSEFNANDVDFNADRIPVVNNEGMLVGVVDREVLLREADTAVTDRGMVPLANDRDTLVEVRSGMEVRGSGDGKLGKLDKIIVERGQVSSFTIAHGLLGRHHKRVTADHVAAVEEDTLRLDFDKTEFGFLSDIEDLDEEVRPASGY
jgi:CBS-domain-containing membrane protein